LAALRALALAFPIVVATLFSHACGVSFKDTFDGTEVFKSISLSGDRTPGSELTIHLQVADGYPVPLQVVCYMEDPNAVTDDQDKQTFNERASIIGRRVLEPQPGRKPGDKGLDRQTLDFSFQAPPPGSYFLACLTPAAADNGLGLDFKIEG
jgi:hypothetical protein